MAEYWISVNESSNKILKAREPIIHTTTYNKWGKWFKKEKDTDEVKEDREDNPLFTVIVNPEQLEKTELVWQIALESEVPEVRDKAVHFLIDMYMSLGQYMALDRPEIMQKLIKKCFELISVADPSPALIKRVMFLLSNII